MNNLQKSNEVQEKKAHKSLSGYVFYEDDLNWQLDKNIKIYLGPTLKLLNVDLCLSYINTLIFFATNLSSGYTRNINDRFNHMLQTTCKSYVDESVLINYRASLSSENEWYLGCIRIFLSKWFELGNPGITEEIIELLYSWNIKGAMKGDVVKRLDPEKGPFSDFEIQGFNEGIVQAFEKNKISITDLTIVLTLV